MLGEYEATVALKSNLTNTYGWRQSPHTQPAGVLSLLNKELHSTSIEVAEA